MRVIQQQNIRGFTLIELSVVLVIIGLIVGGVLVGQELIHAAEVRATIAQVQRYQTAVNTFRVKYNECLPGDMDPGSAQQYGFLARPGAPGQGDGNGLITGFTGVYSGNTANTGDGAAPFGGETAMFWSDLTYANGMNINLIEGSYKTADFTTSGVYPPAIPSTAYSLYLPQAKLGNDNYIAMISLEIQIDPLGWTATAPNYFSIYRIDPTGVNLGNPGISPRIAYEIDRKIDDGLPKTGNVLALYPNTLTTYWQTGFSASAPSDSATTCFNTSTPSGVYSTAYQGGNIVNCGISIVLQ